MEVQGVSVLVIFAIFGTIANAGTTFGDEDSGESESSVEVHHGGSDGYQHYPQEEGPQLFEKNEEGDQQGDFGSDQGGYHGFGQEDSGSFGDDEGKDEGYGGKEGGYGGYYQGGGDESEGSDEDGGKGYKHFK